MTHLPPQFRNVSVLIEEWRRQAAELGGSNAAAADAYRHCADDLERLDVRTGYNPVVDEAEPHGTLRQLARVAVAAGLIAAVFLAIER